MAFTAQELEIARQIKAQWWTREDFLEVMKQIRGQQPQVTEAPMVEEVEPTRLEQEEVITQQIQEAEPTIDPRLAASRARQQLAEQEVEAETLAREAEPGFLWRRAESVKEEVTEWLIGKWLGRAERAGEFVWEWELLKGAWTAFEAWLQITWWTIWELFDQALSTIWEAWIKPVLETLDPDTLAKVWDISTSVMDFVTPSAETQEKIWSALENIPANVRADIEAWLNLLWFKVASRWWKAIVKRWAKSKLL